jgi:hypothetical protein
MFSIQLPSWLPTFRHLPRRSWLPHLAVHHPGVGTGTGRWDATAAHLTRRHVGKATFSRRNWGNLPNINQSTILSQIFQHFHVFFLSYPPNLGCLCPQSKASGEVRATSHEIFSLSWLQIRVRRRHSVIVGTMQPQFSSQGQKMATSPMEHHEHLNSKLGNSFSK